jgi:ABC-type multidrug transport system ATPase subunit
LMYSGEMIVCDEPNRIREMVQGELVEIRTDDWQEARQALQHLPGVLEVQVFGENLRVFLDSAENRIPEIESSLKESGVAIQNIRRTPPRMEEAFISLIRRLEE